jgi:hypothetical protein
MTPTTTRPVVRGRSTQAQRSTRHSPNERLCASLGGIGRARGVTAAAVRPLGAMPRFSLLLPSYCHTSHKPTEEAMPDPDAGPSHRPGARTLGGTS